MASKTLNILLTDDNQDDIELTYLSLKKFKKDYSLDHAITGDECLEKLNNKEYHLLLLDYQMPGKDGISIIDEIRKKGFDLPIIMITGQGSEKVAAESIKLGAQDYIVKAGDYYKTLPLVINKVIEKQNFIMEKENLEKQVRFEQEKLKLIFNNMGDGVCMIDPDFNILLHNNQFEKFFGKASSTKQCFKIIKNNQLDPCPECVDRMENIEPGQSMHFEIVTKDQKTLMVTFTPFHNLEGDRVFLEVFKDITERKESERKLYDASITDSLTGLFNQGHFYKILAREMARSIRNKRPLSLILFDVDKFKEFNDEYGHLGGDKVLKTIGAVILKEIRNELDSAFRYGGDEFTIVLPEASTVQARHIAERIQSNFATFNFTTLSIGIAGLRKDLDINAFIKEADMAMYEAKKSGNNHIIEK